MLVALVSHRYTGLTECDIKLTISNASNDAVVATGVSTSCVLKNTLTFRDVFADAAAKLTAALATPHSPPIDLHARSFTLEFHHTISDELSGSGFQHLCHITTTLSGSGKKRKLDVKYEYPPMATVGQADPRLRVHQHLPGIIDGMVALSKKGDLPSTLIHELQFLPPDEMKNLMKEWSGVLNYDNVDRSDQLLQELFEATAAQYPDNFAIECSGPPFRQMTYAQMSRRTNQLARWMRNNGVTVGSYVGMWMPRGMEVYIALIAILKAGAAYVPIDPSYPSDRVNFILDDCKAPILVTHTEILSEHADFALPPGCQLIQYDQVDELMEAQDSSFPTREQTGQTNRDVCYVIYTSGSTGQVPSQNLCVSQDRSTAKTDDFVSFCVSPF